jgi:hypothetical protein
LGPALWSTPCFHFGLADNPRVEHGTLPSDPNVLNRLLTNLRRTPSHCAG